MGPVDRVSACHRRLRLGELPCLFPRPAGVGRPELSLWDPGPTGAVPAARAARGRLWEGTPVPSCLLRQGGRAPLADSCVQGAPLAGRAAHVLSGTHYRLWPRTGCCSWPDGPAGGPRWLGEPRGHPGSYEHGRGGPRKQKQARESTHVMCQDGEKNLVTVRGASRPWALPRPLPRGLAGSRARPAAGAGRATQVLPRGIT